MNDVESGKTSPPVCTATATLEERPIAVKLLSDDEEESSRDEDRLWAMLAHLLALLGFVVPFGSIIGPLLVLLIKGNEVPFVARHAKESLNFQLSLLVYTLIALLLVFVFVGILLLPVLVVVQIVFVIVAAIKANNGEEYQYPMTVRCIG